MTIAKFSRTKSEIVACTTDAVSVTLYTCPANAKAHMNLLFVTNAAAAASDIDIQWYRASAATSYFIIGGKNLSNGEFIQFDGGAFIVLEAGDYIQITPDNTAGGASPVIDAFCTVEEFFNPVGS
jgi:hypothetical protein